MKTRTLVSILILVLAVLIIAASCATRKIAISDEELSDAYTGTWINEEAGWGIPKIVYFPDGTFKEYIGIDTERFVCAGKDTIIDQWKDPKGNLFYEAKWECFTHGNAGYELVKISDSGNTLERLFTSHDLRVEEWDPDNIHYNYRIWYRQE